MLSVSCLPYAVFLVLESFPVALEELYLSKLLTYYSSSLCFL